MSPTSLPPLSPLPPLPDLPGFERTAAAGRAPAGQAQAQDPGGGQGQRHGGFAELAERQPGAVLPPSPLRLSVHHETRYDYDRPVEVAHHSAW